MKRRETAGYHQWLLAGSVLLLVSCVSMAAEKETESPTPAATAQAPTVPQETSQGAELGAALLPAAATAEAPPSSPVLESSTAASRPPEASAGPEQKPANEPPEPTLTVVEAATGLLETGAQAPAPPPAAQAPAVPVETQNGPIRITGVEIQEAAPGSAIVLIRSDQSVASYETFSLPNPPRLVIDIPQALFAAPRPINEVGTGPIQRVRSSQYRRKPMPVVRVVVDLASSLPYQVEGMPETFRVLIGEAVVKAPPTLAPQTPVVAAQAAPSTPEGRVTNVDYRFEKGESQIVVQTTGLVSFNVVDSPDPTTVILDVAGAVIDPQAAKVLDVRQLPGIVNRIRVVQYRTVPEQVVRVAAELKGQARFDVVQGAEGITLQLTRVAAATPQAAPPAPQPTAIPQMVEKPRVAPAKPVTAAPARPVSAPSNDRLSMDFKDADINNLLRIIAEVSGLNIVAGNEVRGKVTVRLIDVPWEKALDTILSINNFAYVREDNIIRVTTQAKIAKDRQAKIESIRAKEEAVFEPLETQILRVSYAKASDIAKTLDKVKTPRGRIDVDERTASLVLTDTPTTLSRMRELLAELDRPTPQVLIEARIVEISDNFTRELGIQWGFSGAPNVKVGDAGNEFTINEIFGASPANITNPNAVTTPLGALTIPVAVNLATASATGGLLGFTLGKVDDTFVLGAKLNAFERENKTRTLSTPRIVALDNQEAEIKSGTEEPFTTVDSSGRTVISFKEAVLSLKVTPHVTADNRISLKIIAKNDTVIDRITLADSSTPVLSKREATSSLLVENGTTVVIGGLRQATETFTETRVPLLGKIPILGWLFKNRTENVRPRATELLIFVTPTILEQRLQAKR